jgi:hypothetical protein
MATISAGFDQETGKAFISEGDKSIELNRKQVETAIVLLTALLKMDEQSDFVAYLVEPAKVEDVKPEKARSRPTPANHGDLLGDWENGFKTKEKPDDVETKPHKWNLDGSCIACGMRETYLTIERGGKECKGPERSTPPAPSTPYSEFWGGYRGPWLG